MSLLPITIALLARLLPTAGLYGAPLGKFALVYFGRLSGLNDTRGRESTYQADAQSTMRSWKSVLEHVVLPNEGAYNGTVDVYAHNWNCSHSPLVARAFGNRLKASSCHNESHGPYFNFKTWGGYTCEDVNVVAGRMSIQIQHKMGFPEVPQFW